MEHIPNSSIRWAGRGQNLSIESSAEAQYYLKTCNKARSVGWCEEVKNDAAQDPMDKQHKILLMLRALSQWCRRVGDNHLLFVRFSFSELQNSMKDASENGKW